MNPAAHTTGERPASRLGAWEWDLVTNAVQRSPGCYALLGFSPGDIAPDLTGFYSLIHPEDRERVSCALQDAVQGRVPYSIAFRLIDGRWLEDRGDVFSDPDGRPLRMVGVLQDVTENRTLEEAVRVSDERFRLAARAVNGVLYEVDFATDHVVRSEALCSLVGVYPEEAEPTQEWWRARIHPDDAAKEQPRPLQTLADAGEVAYTREYRVRHRDGRWIPVWDRGVIVRDTEGRPIRAVGLTVDMTERLQMEEALRRSERDLRTIVEHLPDVIARFDRELRYIFVSPSNEIYTGRPLVENLGRTDREIGDLPEPVLSEWETALRRAFATGKLGHFEHDFDTLLVPEPGDDGTVETVLVVSRDVRERKRAERALRESQERLSIAQREARIGTWEWDIANSRVEWSPEYYVLHGVDPSMPPSQEAWLNSIHPEDREWLYSEIERSLHARKDVRADYRVRLPDGRVRWLQGFGRLFCDAEGCPVRMVGMNMDITDRKAQQEEIEILNARLKRSLAETHHRVKNNLQVVSALAELQVGEGNTVPAEAMRRVAQHARSLSAIHDLLTQEAKSGGEVHTLDVQEMLERLIPLLEATTGGRSLRWRSASFALPIREAASLALLVSELVSNAAKHGSGEIEVTLEVGESQSEACLLVCDEGPGFPPDFDPRRSANTGLELIDSTGRYDLRGTITFENLPEGGSCVRVVFPIA